MGKATIGATAEVTELDSGVSFMARVDTGATVSSLHYERLEISGDDGQPQNNVGKIARVLIENRAGEQAWIESRIVDHATIRNAVDSQDRYYLRLRLRCRGVEKETLVTLSDRSRLGYAMLIGRDFLSGDFVVDVDRDNPETL
ncbi:putative ATP-dependent zinc protease [Pseudobythopirellula maris]|uniref:putative ATP-dependent zinc protease n=1 Tax=Pseudobythopirellula maris TaxID=2527991 RepID=UPI0018D30BCE|nr:RimK/LysX family protein [Pseudobythopirellula maris]